MEQYSELFSVGDKAKAFDELAKRYYSRNFGTLSKSDIDTLMFSLYIERILDNSEEDMSKYRDYLIARQLGITESRVRSLKIKKQLQYPRKYDWKAAFLRTSEKAGYEDGKIKISISDPNLFIEIKDAVEQSGGYIDIQLNSKLLQVRPEWFVELLLLTQPRENKASIEKALRQQLSKQADMKGLLPVQQDKNIPDEIKRIGGEVVGDLVSSLLSVIIPIAGPALGAAAKHTIVLLAATLAGKK